MEEKTNGDKLRRGGGLWLKKYSRAERPWEWGILVYGEVTSMVAVMVLGGRGVGRDRKI